MKPPFPLRQLVVRLGALSVEGALDAPITALAYDERRVIPGSLFFALPGRGGDATHAIPRAIERGAAAIVCEQGGHVPYRAARIRVAHCRDALATAAAAFHDHPGQKLQIVVVTGCAGRTAVAHLLGDLFAGAGVDAGLISSLGCRGGGRTLPPLTGVPEALDLQERLADFVRAGCRACVVELPGEAIAMGCLDAMEVDTVVATRVLADGEGARSHGEASRPAAWESRLSFRVPAGGRRAGGVWRVVDMLEGRATVQAGLLFHAHYGPGPAGSFRARWGRFTPRGTRLELDTPGGSCVVRLPLPGQRVARAALAAVAIAQGLRLPLPALASSLARATPVPGQLEPVSNGHPVHVLVDAGGSARELEETLQELRGVSHGRLLLLLGCGHRHAPASRPGYGEVAARCADHTVLTSDSPGTESPEVIAAQVASGFLRVKGAPPRIVPDRDVAIRELLRDARPGDCVLLAGKGHRSVQELGDCVVPFDDGAEARAVLGGHPRPSPAETVEVCA